MEQEIIVNGVQITDSKTLEEINRPLLKEAKAAIKPKIASAVEAILKEKGIALDRR